MCVCICIGYAYVCVCIYIYIYRIWYYLRFQVSTGGLGTNSPHIRRDCCIFVISFFFNFVLSFED